jgi:hypothetical protein
MKLALSKLNGWQRAFVLIALLWTITLVCVFPYQTYVDKDGIVNLKIKEQIASANKGRPPLDLRGIDLGPREKWDIGDQQRDQTYVMPDGERIVAWNINGKEGVEKAYAEALPLIEVARKKQFREDLQQYILVLLIPLLGLYTFGWMVGWIYRGFKKPL